jgi:hypothetical protein
MNEKTYSQVLNDVAQDSVPAGLDLAPKIIARVQKGKSGTMQPRIKVFGILLVLVMFLMTTTVVAAAIQHWFGYVPGFGLVRNGQLRKLAEPVSITQNGFSLRVDEAILSSEKTVVSYSMAGITADMQAEPGGCRGENSAPVIRLSDGSKLELKGLLSSNTYNVEATFTAMPADVNEAALIINCIDYVSQEQVPQLWEVPLRFVAASPELTVVPVLDAPVTGWPTVVATVESPLSATVQPVVSRGGLILKNAIPIQSGYILSGTIIVVPPVSYTVVENYGGYLDDIFITDASGQALTVDMAPDDFINSTLPSALPENTYGWACQVNGKNIQWPLTMTVHSLEARGSLLPEFEFQLNVGSDPKADQVWKLDQDVLLGAKTAHIVSVRRLKGEHGISGYEFTLVFDPRLDFWPEIEGYQRMGGGGGPLNEDGTYTRVLGYPEPVPAGVLTVLVNGNELIQLPGPWQATWQAPVDAGRTPTP